MSTVANQTSVPDSAAVFRSNAQPLDNTLQGALAGLYKGMAAASAVKIDGASAEVDGLIRVAELRGQLIADLTEMDGMLDKPTTKISDLKEPDKSRAQQLIAEINRLCVQLGYCQEKDGAGRLISAPASASADAKPLFAGGNRVVTLPPDPADVAAAQENATLDAWSNLQQELAAGKNPDIQRAVARVANGMEAMGIDLVNNEVGDKTPVEITNAGGQEFAASSQLYDGRTQRSSWLLFQNAFAPNKAALLARGDSKLDTSVNNVQKALDAQYKAAYQEPPRHSIVNGLLASDDGATIKSALVLVQGAANVDSQNINRAMSRFSNLVQDSNSYLSGANSVIEGAMRTNRAILGGS